MINHPTFLNDKMILILDRLQQCSSNTKYDPRIENDCSKDKISKNMSELLSLMKHKFENQDFVNTYKLTVENVIYSIPIKNKIWALFQDQFNELKKVWQLEEIRKMCYESIISSLLDKYIFIL